jgi:type I restriction enzyme S subunit
VSSFPSAWTLVEVDALAGNERGAITDGPFGSNLKTSHYTPDGPRVIRLQNIGEGVFLDERAHIDPDHYERLARHQARSGDIVVAMLGEELPRACLVPAWLGPAIVKADCVRLRVDSRVAFAPFVMHGLNSEFLREQASDRVHGVGRPRLGLARFRTLRFPLAPRRTQERVVESIESYLTRIDDAVASLERVQRNLKRYRAAVLQAAVEGRLVPTEAELARAEGRSFEPASELLARILAERRRRWEEAELAKLRAKGKEPKNDAWKARYSEPAAGDTSGMPDLPHGWCWTSLEAITSATRLIQYGILMPKDHVSDGVPYIKVRDMKQNRLDVANLQRTSPVIASRYQRSSLKAGDLVLAIRGTYGRVVEVPSELDGGNVTQDSARLDLLAAIDRKYIRYCLLSQRIQNYFTRVARGVAVKGVNIAEVRTTPIPLAPVVEQHRIVDQIDDLLSIEEDGERAVESSLTRCHRLRQSILAWAFEGKLVDQDPTDEPASVLLDRIRAERAAAAPAPSGARRRRARLAPDPELR